MTNQTLRLFLGVWVWGQVGGGWCGHVRERAAPQRNAAGRSQVAAAPTDRQRQTRRSLLTG